MNKIKTTMLVLLSVVQLAYATACSSQVEHSSPTAYETASGYADSWTPTGTPLKSQTVPQQSGTSGSTGKTSRKAPNDQPFIVCIDPGHGGIDPGTNGNELVEKNITLDVGLKLNAILQEKGISSYMIRTSDVNIDRIDRITIANEKKFSLFISIHCDWFKDASVKGTGTFYYPSSTLKLNRLSEYAYAQNIQSELIKKTQTRSRGLIDSADLAVLRRAVMPSVLVELGFLSNKSDAKLLASEDFHQTIAEGLAEGIIKSLKKAAEQN